MLIVTCNFDLLKARLLMSGCVLRYTSSEHKLTGTSTEIRLGLKRGMCFLICTYVW